jgi:hypothetical protein
VTVSGKSVEGWSIDVEAFKNSVVVYCINLTSLINHYCVKKMYLLDSFSFNNMCLVPGHTFRYFTLGAMKHRFH